ncbi:hypothetical protein NKG94_30945 [Micromonospora sp. M12]
MPLHLPEPPAGVPGHVRSKLHAFANGSKFSTKALRGARKDQLDISTPHQVFNLESKTPPAVTSTGRNRWAGATWWKTADN